MGRDLRPQPPPLADVVAEWSAAELFWIVKHGIRMAHMPAWNPTHGDNELWAIVAFVQTHPPISAEDGRMELDGHLRGDLREHNRERG